MWRELIATLSPGRVFADVGCMWRVHGGYSFHAVEHGAAKVTGIDLLPATPEFLARNAQLGEPVRFVRGDLNDPEIETWAGQHEVVFCSGVLYHVPNPVQSLIQLRRICSDVLILTTASLMDLDTPNVAVFLPGMSDADREKLNFAGPARKGGLDIPFDIERGYANWFWLPTPSCVVAMVEQAGFTVEQCIKHRRVTTVVARAAKRAPSDLRSPAHRQ